MNRTDSPALTAIVAVVNIIVWMVLIAALGIGAMHVTSCPLKPYIPVYLLVLSASSIVSLLMVYVKDTLPEGRFTTVCSVCLPLFSVCWLIAGTVSVYSIYPPNYDSTNGEGYCQKTVYLFAFWFTCLCWLLAGVALVCGGLYLIYMCVKSSQAFRGQHLFPSCHGRSYGTAEEA